MADEVSEKSEFLPNSEFKKEKDEKENKQQDDIDTTCGIWIFKGSRLQSLANEHMYVVLYGLAGCFIGMAFSYFNGTLTTLEKRYKIPTKTSGFISVGNDISTTIFSAFLGYYAGNKHRPRWVGFGLFTLSVFCLLMVLPHLIYGAGEEALKFTRDYVNQGYSNTTQEDLTICHTTEDICEEKSELLGPIILLFFAQFVSGFGCSLFYTLGIAYMDDNLTKSKVPAMLSWSSFLRMLGPALGYSLSSLCLRLYIDPRVDTVITKEDTRWLGAWWLGWLILAIIMLISAFSIYLFPKELPSAKERRLKQITNGKDENETTAITELSFKDMLSSVKRLAKNRIYIYNTMASLLYCFGYMPYWIYTPKYIETQYQQSAATATLATGTFGLGFSAAGILLSGYVISKYKPSARSMAAWNGIVDILTVAGILCYIFIGCDDSDKATSLMPASDSCSASCHCEYVHYAPICTPDNVTYISACHAGCSNKTKDELGRFLYSDCKCIAALDIASDTKRQFATQGPCPVDCQKEFLIFVAVMCFLKFVGATGRSSNMLMALRCVSPKDKSFALALGSVGLSIFCFIPSPILFGWILDSYCLVWGKTCSSQGNCWVYDTKSLRFTMHFLAACCIFAGSFWNIGVWIHAKDLQIFDNEEKDTKKKTEDVELSLTEKPKEITKN